MKEDEKKQLVEAPDTEQLEKIWQEANDRRSFLGHCFWIIFFSLIFFGWNKFWSWYEKPVKQEWDWAEENEDEEQAKPEPEPEENPPKGWKWFKNLVLDNKIKTASLVGMVVASLWLVVRVIRLL